MNIAVFVSGKGSNLQALIDASRAGALSATIAVVVTDARDAYACTRAEKAGIPVLYVDPGSYSAREDYDRELLKRLSPFRIHLVVLAGYMRILSPVFLRAYTHRILNVHPSLLPAFKGTDGVKDALRHGVKITGVTVHFVSETLDDGPIIAQVPVEVRGNDTAESLRERIHEAEHALYPRVIEECVRGYYTIEGRKVVRREGRA